jgi:SAM-dependent methyltransferase
VTATRGSVPPRRADRRYRYLLGDSRREAARLRAQARLWDPTARALFDRLGVRRGWRVLEIGPGQGSLHMDLRRRVRGPVDAVERSPAFAARLRLLCARDGLGTGRIWETDLLDAPLPRGLYDLVFARWVFLFLPDPEVHLRRLARSLRPGGLMAIEDYHRETFALVPRPPEWTNFLAADRAFFASQGGDVSVGGRLPELYGKAGLRLVEIVPTIKVGRPDSAVWTWLSTYFLGVLDRYAQLPPFTKAQAARLRRRWLRAAGRTTSLMIAPAVLDVVGRKPRTERRGPRS